MICTWLGVGWIDTAGWDAAGCDTVVAGVVTSGNVFCCGALVPVKEGSACLFDEGAALATSKENVGRIGSVNVSLGFTNSIGGS